MIKIKNRFIFTVSFFFGALGTVSANGDLSPLPINNDIPDMQSAIETNISALNNSFHDILKIQADLKQVNTDYSNIQLAQVNSGQIELRLNMIEDQLRQVTGLMQVLGRDLTILKDQFKNFAQDTEFRFQDLEGGSANTGGYQSSPEPSNNDFDNAYPPLPLDEIPMDGQGNNEGWGEGYDPDTPLNLQGIYQNNSFNDPSQTKELFKDKGIKKAYQTALSQYNNRNYRKSVDLLDDYVTLETLPQDDDFVDDGFKSSVQENTLANQENQNNTAKEPGLVLVYELYGDAKASLFENENALNAWLSAYKIEKSVQKRESILVKIAGLMNAIGESEAACTLISLHNAQQETLAASHFPDISAKNLVVEASFEDNALKSLIERIGCDVSEQPLF